MAKTTARPTRSRKRASGPNDGRRDQLAIVRKARTLERQIRKDARALTRDRLAADGALSGLLAVIALARGEEVWPAATIAQWRKDLEQLRADLAVEQRRNRELNDAWNAIDAGPAGTMAGEAK